MAKKTHSSTTNTTEFERLLNSISNNTPMLFFPVRIETHFRNQTYEAPKETDLLKILKSFKNLSEEVINLKLSRKKLSLTPALAKTLGTVRSADLISKENIKELTLLCNDVFDEINAMGANTKYTKYKEDILVALNDVAIAKEEVVSEEEKEEEAEEVDTSSFLEKKIAEKAPKLLFPGQKIIFNTKAKGISQLQAWTEDTIFTLTRNLKTNFKPYTQKELCVRIFPTEIFLDYLTDALTEAEIADGKMFWLQWYVASGSKKSEYEAWRVLCAKYPVYRAAWIVRSMKPKNINKYKKGNTWFYRRPYQGMEEIQEGCLTIYNNLAKITLSEQQDVNPNTTEYNNETKIREHIGIIKENLFHIESKIMICEYIVDYLYDNISSTVNYLKRRLNSFLRFYERFPGIYGDNPRQMELWDVDYTMLKTFRNEVNLLLEKLTSKRISLQDIMNKYLDDPKHMKEFFPTVQVNKSGKPDMPVSNILPDRFLFIGEEDNRKAKVVQQIGKRVKRNLQMGINLNEDAEAEPYKISNTGELEVNGGLAWMVDYDKAEEAGMAITVPVDMSVSGFKYIYVLGVCTPTEKEDKVIQNLFNSHNYTSSGLALLNSGTPTNIVEGGKPAYNTDPEEEMRARYEIEVEEIFNNSDKNEYDAMAISKVMRLSYNQCWSRVKQFDNKGISNAEKAYDILWKHFTKNVTNTTLKKTLDDVGWFLVNHVKARGTVPSFRIENQPYGIVHTTNFMNLKSNFGGIEAYYKQLFNVLKASGFSTDQLNQLKTEFKNYETKVPFVSELCNLLVTLANDWKRLREANVFSSEKLTTSSKTNPEKNFLTMAGLTPYSTTFHQRWLIESPLLPKREANVPPFLKSLHDAGYFNPIPVKDVSDELEIKELITANFNEAKKELEVACPNLSDAEKELLFSEFFDLFTYRLDAWFMGILDFLLHAPFGERRYPAPKIGAYGWVFNLKENKRNPVSPAEQKKIIQDMKLDGASTDIPIYKNTGKTQGQYILAPSLHHAITAAILRGSYLRTRKKDEDSHLCVNLSSMRARQALRMIDGIQSGMSTGIILGADLERYLHEADRNGNEKEQYDMDQYIYPLRKIFPQTVDLTAEDKRAQDYVMEVINGETLLNTFIGEWDHSGSLSQWLEIHHLRSASLEWFRLFAAGTGMDATAKAHHRKCFFKLLERLMDSYDALNDLLLAEGVHRLVQGDQSAYAAIIGFMQNGKGNLPHPEVLNTPMEHVAVAHKTGIVFPRCTQLHTKPMPLAEPSVNLWLEQLIGSMDNILFWVQENNEKDTINSYSLGEMEITPIEYLYLSATEQVFLSYLETRWRLKYNNFFGNVTLYFNKPETEDNGIISIDVNREEDNCFSVYENELRMENLRNLLHYGHAMALNDFVSSTTSDGEDEQAVDQEDLIARYNTLHAQTVLLNGDMKHCLQHLESALRQEGILPNQKLTEMYEMLCRCMEAGHVNSLPKFNPNIFMEMVAPTAIPLTPDEDEVITLRINPIIQPLEFQKAAEMQKEFVAAFAFARQQLEERIAEANEIMKTSNEEQFVSSKLMEAIQKLLLKNFRVFPLFTLDEAIKEKKSSYNAVLKEGISYYKNLNQNKFDEWQSEIAEVREGMKSWHHVSMFQTMCNRDLGNLSILQTNADGDVAFNKWLGCSVAQEADLQDVDSLVIYNSDKFNLGAAPDKPAYNSGMIMDSWLEFIPYKKHSAGMAFHCDRPDNEAPQALLLALHPEFNLEGKKWNLDAVTELLDSTRFMLMNRAVEPDHIYQDKELSTLFPLLSTFFTSPKTT